MKYFGPGIFLLCLCLAAGAQNTRNLTLHFETGSSKLTPAENNRLDSMLDAMSKKKLLFVSIDAYCDSRGNTQYNQLLSEKRAQAIAQLIRKYKKDSMTVDILAHDENDSLASNANETGMQNNRSVVLRFRLQKSVSRAVSAKPAAEPVPKNILPDSFVVGTTVVLKNINFSPGTDVLLPQSYPVLEQLLNVLKKNPTMQIEIMGHVCCFDDYALSLARAKKIFSLLVQQGIDPARLNYCGYSNRKRIASDDTEPGRIQNRRVEIKITRL